VRRDGLTQAEQAGVGSVEGVAASGSLGHGLLDEGRGGQVRLAELKGGIPRHAHGNFRDGAHAETGDFSGLRGDAGHGASSEACWSSSRRC
jgi:hypothetical protein